MNEAILRAFGHMIVFTVAFTLIGPLLGGFLVLTALLLVGLISGQLSAPQSLGELQGFGIVATVTLWVSYFLGLLPAFITGVAVGLASGLISSSRKLTIIAIGAGALSSAILVSLIIKRWSDKPQSPSIVWNEMAPVFVSPGGALFALIGGLTAALLTRLCRRLCLSLYSKVPA